MVVLALNWSAWATVGGNVSFWIWLESDARNEVTLPTPEIPREIPNSEFELTEKQMCFTYAPSMRFL